jgi:SAM-dependent methyltransferase
VVSTVLPKRYRFRTRLGASATLVLIVLGWSLHLTAQSQATGDGEPSSLSLHTTEIFKLAKSLSSGESLADAYPAVVKLAFQVSADQPKGLVAFEENRFFVDAVGRIRGASTRAEGAEGPRPDREWLRRFIVLKPSTFVVDDEPLFTGSRFEPKWRLYSRTTPQVSGRRARYGEQGSELVCETLLPEKPSQNLTRHLNSESESEGYSLDVATRDSSAAPRFIHVLHAVESGPWGPEVHSQCTLNHSLCRLTISTQHRIFRLYLPRPSEGAGAIGISGADGKTLVVDDRPLPAGILPHGPEGMRDLDRWDADYRGDRPPLWDAGKPSGELKKVVENGTIRPSRAVELGSGSGTDAIYLASRGFDVTAIEIAPTALGQAQKKARKAGVTVRWLLADVLAPPDLEPFDFIYDRGCYHVVRDENLAAYLETVRRLSRPGTRFLLLAGNAEDPTPGYGLPRVSEEELRNDFLSLFDFDWLRQSRFEVSQSGVLGPLAWSVLLRRRATH